jgi:hypothetical protein
MTPLVSSRFSTETGRAGYLFSNLRISNVTISQTKAQKTCIFSLIKLDLLNIFVTYLLFFDIKILQEYSIDKYNNFISIFLSLYNVLKELCNIDFSDIYMLLFKIDNFVPICLYPIKQKFIITLIGSKYSSLFKLK